MMTLHREKICARALLVLAACALSCALAMGAHAPAFAAGSSAETEIGVVFVEEPQAGGQTEGPSNPDPGQTNLPQKDAPGSLLAGGQGGPSWLLTTGDATAKASGALALIAAVAALACLIAAHRIGKEANHVR